MAQVKYCLYCGRELCLTKLDGKEYQACRQRTADMFIGIIL